MRTPARARGSMLACVLLLVACGGHAVGASGAAPVAPGGDWAEFDYNPQRSGVGPADTGITASTLGSLRRRVVHLDGTVDSSAIELHAIRVRGRVRDVIVMTTTYGRTIAVDPGTGARLWEYVPPDIRTYEASAQVMTASPVADPNRRYVYSASPDGRIHKIGVATGREVKSRHWPAQTTFDASHEKLAAALNVSGKAVIVATGGYYGDAPPYQGHVVTIDRGTGAVTKVWNSLCSNRHHLIDPPGSCAASDSAIWGRAGVVVEPGSGRLLLATGNGPFDGVTSWGDSVLELSPDAGRLLHNWTPRNQKQLNASDTDVGSSAPAVLPFLEGRRLAVQGGKDGVLRLLDLARLDGTGHGAGSRLGGALQGIPLPGSGELLTAPAVWTEAGHTYVLVAEDSGTAAYELTFAGHHPRLQVAWERGTPGTSPVVAGGLLYVYDEIDGRLTIRRPASGQTLASLPAGRGHWNSPIVVGGRIVLPEGNANDHATRGTVEIYHLPGR